MLETGRFHGELTHRRADGKRIHIESRAAALFDSEGKRLGYVSVNRDITERRYAEETIRALLNEVLTAQEAERRRIARELHDDTAQTLTSLLVGLRAVEESKELDTALASGEHAARAGGRRLARRAAHGPGASSERARRSGARGSARASGARCEPHQWIPGRPPLHRPAPAPPPEGLEIALYRMAQEALTNATKHAAPKAVSILVHRNPTEVRLVVEDDGKGFDDSEILSESQLGLVGMRERAHLVGGSMTLESSPGHGTTICIRVPLAAKKPSVVMSIRVFIADDHGILRGGLRALITLQPDMEVVGEAANGSEAEIGVKNTEPDVVLMDITMPNGGGLAAIAAVKQVRPKTRIIVLTMHDELGYVRAAGQAGAVGYVVKSAVDTELLAAIRAVAQGRTFIDASLGLGFATDPDAADLHQRPWRNGDGAADRARAGGHAAGRGGLHQLANRRGAAPGRQVGRNLSFQSDGKAGSGISLCPGEVRPRLRRSRGRGTVKTTFKTDGATATSTIDKSVIDHIEQRAEEFSAHAADAQKVLAAWGSRARRFTRNNPGTVLVGAVALGFSSRPSGPPCIAAAPKETARSRSSPGPRPGRASGRGRWATSWCDRPGNIPAAPSPWRSALATSWAAAFFPGSPPASWEQGSGFGLRTALLPFVTESLVALVPKQSTQREK